MLIDHNTNLKWKINSKHVDVDIISLYDIKPGPVPEDFVMGVRALMYRVKFNYTKRNNKNILNQTTNN